MNQSVKEIYTTLLNPATQIDSIDKHEHIYDLGSHTGYTIYYNKHMMLHIDLYTGPSDLYAVTEDQDLF